MAEQLQTIEIETRPKPSHSIIWLHGLGADGNDFVPIARELSLPPLGIRFVFPHAPMRPVTINGGFVMRAWYDIAQQDLVRKEDEQGVRQSQKMIEELIAKEETRGVPANRIVVAGFSQGGVISLQTGLRQPKRLAGVTVTSTTSFTDWKLAPYDNRLVVFGGGNLDSALTQSQRAFNEELRFSDGPLTGGVFYSHASTHGAAQRSFSGFPIEDSSFTLGSESLAVFSQGRFPTGAGWFIAPGLRLEHDAKDFTRAEFIPGQSLHRQKNSWDALLPSLSATRRFDARTDLTLTAARGFKPGGYSAYTGIASLAAYAPQSTWGLEAALTTAAAKSKWTFVSRAYAYRVSGYQIERSFAVPGSAGDEYLVVNARRAQVLGLELEGNWRPAADVTVRAVAGLTRVTLQDFTDPFTQANYSGDRAPYAPAGNAALRVDYHPARGFFCGAGLTWTGRTFYDERETAGLAQNAYALVDAAIGCTFARAEFRIFGRNLADKAYYSAIVPGVAHATPGAPLTWGAALSCRW